MGSSLQLLVASVVGMTALMMTTKAYVDRYIPKPPASEKKASDKSKKKKKKGSLGESFAVLKSSPMISNLALLVVGYGLTHRLFEFCWKGQLRLLYPSAAAYQVRSVMLHPSSISLLLVRQRPTMLSIMGKGNEIQIGGLLIGPCLEAP